MIAEAAEQFRFGHGLGRLTADTADADERRDPTAVGAIHLLRRECQDGLEESDARIADGELRRVDADRESTGSGRIVVPRECPLAAFVECAGFSQCQRMCGNDEAVPQRSQDRRGNGAHSESSVARLEVSRLVEEWAAACHPVRRPGDQAIELHARRAERGPARGPVAQEGVGRFCSHETRGYAHARGERFTDIADREGTGTGEIHDGCRRGGVRQRRERHRICVSLPDRRSHGPS